MDGRPNCPELAPYPVQRGTSDLPGPPPRSTPFDGDVIRAVRSRQRATEPAWPAQQRRSITGYAEPLQAPIRTRRVGRDRSTPAGTILVLGVLFLRTMLAAFVGRAFSGRAGSRSRFCA